MDYIPIVLITCLVMVIVFQFVKIKKMERIIHRLSEALNGHLKDIKL